VDGVEYDDYVGDADVNIKDLHLRLHKGTYKALPSLRRYIPKQGGGMRPLGIAAVEDKIVQRAVVAILSSIYEVDFSSNSYGFRPEIGCHMALDKLFMDITTRKVNWIVDADIQSFFNSISHDWLIRFLEHRIGDPRILRLIKLWLKAGVVEDGEWANTEVGSAQGSSASPLLANVFLHYALDLWVEKLAKEAKGEVHYVRYADDFVTCLQSGAEAVEFLESLKVRLAKFELKLHPDKTRLIEFGRFAAENRRKRGQGKPETFDFLGFTHSCSIARSTKKFKLLRRTISKRLRAKLVKLYGELRKRINMSISEVGEWLKRSVNGYYRYFAVPDNLTTLGSFRHALAKLWLKVVRRRSQKAKMNWKGFAPIVEKWLPPPKRMHPYPSQRMTSKSD
jgi:group II intron reverse transcriptase/maturase